VNRGNAEFEVANAMLRGSFAGLQIANMDRIFKWMKASSLLGLYKFIKRGPEMDLRLIDIRQKAPASFGAGAFWF